MFVETNRPIYRDDKLWVKVGKYFVIRQFDKKRKLIETGDNQLTLINDADCKEVNYA